jgi:hypothetical protein
VGSVSERAKDAHSRRDEDVVGIRGGMCSVA